MVYDGRESAINGGHNYGVHVRVDHGNGYETTYAHLDKRIVNVGNTVVSGQVIGFADNTGNSSGSHLHLTLKKDGVIVDPMPFLFDLFGRERGKTYIDLLPYMKGVVGKPYMIKNANGASERYEVQLDETDKRGWTWYITKNSQWEKWGCSGEFIRLYQDTSPEPLNGKPVYYKVIDGFGDAGGRWCPRFMEVGQRYEEAKPHFVKFFNKADGLDANSPYTGYATNRTLLQSWDGTTIKIGNVPTQDGGEWHIFDLNYGRIGWESVWGSASISADEAGTWHNTREVVA